MPLLEITRTAIGVSGPSPNVLVITTYSPSSDTKARNLKIEQGTFTTHNGKYSLSARPIPAMLFSVDSPIRLTVMYSDSPKCEACNMYLEFLDRKTFCPGVVSASTAYVTSASTPAAS